MVTIDQDAATQLIEKVCLDNQQKHLKTTDLYGLYGFIRYSYLCYLAIGGLELQDRSLAHSAPRGGSDRQYDNVMCRMV